MDSLGEYLKIDQYANVQDAVYHLRNTCTFVTNELLDQLKKDNEYERRRNEYLRRFNKVPPHRQNKAVAKVTYGGSDTFSIVRGSASFFVSPTLVTWLRKRDLIPSVTWDRSSDTDT